jgi:hypothetical protein
MQIGPGRIRPDRGAVELYMACRSFGLATERRRSCVGSLADELALERGGSAEAWAHEAALLEQGLM